MEKPKVVFFSEKDVQEYVKQFPVRTEILMTAVELDCIGHTYRQVMGYDELDCGVKHDFLEHPRRYLINELWHELIDFLRL